MLRLTTFGGLWLEGDEGPLTGAAAQRRRLVLLAALAAAGQKGMSRDAVVGLLWPEVDESRARAALSQALYVLKRDTGEDELVLGHDVLTLNSDILWSDVSEFERAIARGDFEAAARRARRSSCERSSSSRPRQLAYRCNCQELATLDEVQRIASALTAAGSGTRRIRMAAGDTGTITRRCITRDRARRHGVKHPRRAALRNDLRESRGRSQKEALVTQIGYKQNPINNRKRRRYAGSIDHLSTERHLPSGLS